MDRIISRFRILSRSPLLSLSSSSMEKGLRIYAGNSRNSLATNRPETAGSVPPPRFQNDVLPGVQHTPGFTFFRRRRTIISFHARHSFRIIFCARTYDRGIEVPAVCIACITIVTGFGESCNDAGDDDARHSAAYED